MTYFESSARVPLLVHYPKLFKPFKVAETVSTIDILPTLVDLSGAKLVPYLQIDGSSLLPQLRGKRGNDTVFAEYCGEGTISPMMMIRRGPWKFIICPADPIQLYNLSSDPLELVNLAQGRKPTDENDETGVILASFYREAMEKWDFKRIEQEVRLSQRQRRFVWSALKKGRFTSWDFNPVDDAREKYIRSHVPLDDLELRARYPPVDTYGKEVRAVKIDQAGSRGQ
jgi:arylsulfatase A-like enzyme